MSEIPKGMPYVLQLSDRAPSHVARILLPAADLAADMPPLTLHRVRSSDAARRDLRAIVCRVTTAC